jgi:methylenetetrahydrofolate reductase (NADPH)
MKADSRLERLLAGGTFAVTAELGPPKGADPEVIRRKADILRGSGDAFNITDCQTAVTRLSSIAAAALMMPLGLEPVVQMVTRDRNRIALQADALGAAALGVKNVLCLSGDHQKFGNHPTAKGVFDLDSLQLVSCLRKMRDEGKFVSGDDISTPPKFFIGAVENPFADPLEFRVVRLGKKIAAGADFIQTQGVFDLERFRRWMELVRAAGLHEKTHIMAGIIPMKSGGMAAYMQSSVPGVVVPDDMVARMRGAKEKGTTPKEEGIAIAVEIIDQVRAIEGVRGVHIMAVEWEEAVPEIAQRAGLLPRPEPA